MRRSLEALTHLWSDGFSRDSGLKRAKGGTGEEEEEGMQCERRQARREEGQTGSRRPRVRRVSRGGRCGLPESTKL